MLPLFEINETLGFLSSGTYLGTPSPENLASCILLFHKGGKTFCIVYKTPLYGIRPLVNMFCIFFGIR